MPLSITENLAGCEQVRFINASAGLTIDYVVDKHASINWQRFGSNRECPRASLHGLLSLVEILVEFNMGLPAAAANSNFRCNYLAFESFISL
jgi:hypothetical protein